MAIQQERFLAVLNEAELWRQLALQHLPEDYPYPLPSNTCMLIERNYFNRFARKNIRERERLRRKRAKGHPQEETPNLIKFNLTDYSPEELAEMFKEGD